MFRNLLKDTEGSVFVRDNFKKLILSYFLFWILFTFMRTEKLVVEQTSIILIKDAVYNRMYL